MQSVAIGVWAYEQPQELAATLEALRNCTAGDARVVILADGPDAATSGVLASFGDALSATTEPRGPAACFNRLVATEADVYVFLESGVRVGSRWLEWLLAALAADASNGLAGPSTNRVWNEQCVRPDCDGSPLEIERMARELANRFQGAIRTLEPLYSLADYCYAVRREVVQAVGQADELYGLGPCWEMDYNIRAARAGFRGLWAQSAFVWRGQPPLRRQYSEALLFDSNKRRYQDKFCGRRLRGEHFPYEQHCRGDACEHFAPSRLVNISGCATAASPPMVTCLMPTRGRREEVLQSVRYFQRQTWPERELIILDDADGEDLSTLLPTDPAIRYFRLPAGQSIGAKRNRGCELARGGIVAQWDDDDWYGPRRLEVQVRPIVTGQADMTGLAAFFFDLPAWTFWTCTPKLHARIFYGDVHGGTLTFRRELWERGARYPDASLAEDAAFLQRVLLSGGRLLRIENDGHFLYIRHGDNSWKLECGRYGEASGWRRMAEPEFWRADRNFYSARSSAITAEARQPTSLDPLVTCVMPTAGRREFAARAISYFQRQNYPNRELLILDDGAEPIEDLVPSASQINYVRLHTRSTLGSKRNMAASLARGEIIAHWDDDDWIAEWRLAYQVQALLRQADDAVCGLNRLLHLQHGARSAWLYTYPPQERGWLAGGTLCYRKTLLQRHPFPDVNDGEDTRFVWTLPASSLVAHPDHTFYVATVHAHNTSRKNTSDGRWQSREVNEIQRLMQDDFEFYRSGH